MNKRLLILIIFAALAHNCFAQFGGSMRRSRGADTGQSTRGVDGVRSVSPYEQINSSLYDLRIRLLITPQQSPAFDSFRNALINLATAGAPLRINPEEQTALVAVQRQNEWAKNRADIAVKLFDSTSALFASLTPEQQVTADQLIPKLIADADSSGIAKTAQRNFVR